MAKTNETFNKYRVQQVVRFAVAVISLGVIFRCARIGMALIAGIRQGVNSFARPLLLLLISISAWSIWSIGVVSFVRRFRWAVLLGFLPGQIGALASLEWIARQMEGVEIE